MKPILPGATVGVFGSGQLGRMFALEAKRLGYRVHTFSPDVDTPMGSLSDREITAEYEDLDAVRAFARDVDVVTFEFENVPVAAALTAAELAPVHPDGSVLNICQQRVREKTFLRTHGFPVADFRVVQSVDQLRVAVSEIGTPAILKTARFGYDGKGQVRVRNVGDVDRAWLDIGGEEAVLEAFIDFEMELSVVAARSRTGAFAHYGVMENHHHNHILDWTICPARVPPRVAREAVRIAQEIMESLRVVGVLCVEFFLQPGGSLLVNELAPRPHNSGHLTLDAFDTSQFEQQLRAICGLPLGSVKQHQPAAMVNLMGEGWEAGEPDWEKAFHLEDIYLHLYGKRDARRGRKMGHMTALSETGDRSLERALATRSAVFSRTRLVPPLDRGATLLRTAMQ